MNSGKTVLQNIHPAPSLPPVVRVVAVGDCNSITANPQQGTIADGVSGAFSRRGVQIQLANLSGGMRTTREGLANLKDHPDAADVAVVNFGLVDSWSTSVPALYVRYYPDNAMRKRLRKIVKFIKRRLRSPVFRQIIPFGRVVPLSEYIANVSAMVKLLQARNAHVQIFLWGTVPVIDRPHRNPDLVEYNSALERVATDLGVHYVDSERAVGALKMEERFVDGAHLSPAAVALIGEDIVRVCCGEACHSVGAKMRHAA